MCFEIDGIVKPWKNRVVYKVLEGHPRRKTGFVSPYQQAVYALGKAFSIPEKAVTSKQDRHGWRAEGGVYVFNTIKAAIHEAKGNNTFDDDHKTVVVACKVKPEDFLFTDGIDTATYRTIIPMKVIRTFRN